MTLKRSFAFIFVGAFLTVAAATTVFAVEPKTLTLAEVKELVAQEPAKGGYALFDARSEAKFNGGHLPWAKSLPYEEMEQLLGELPTDKTVPLVFYCDGPKCNLSGKGARYAIEEGYTDVAVFTAGMPGWKKGGNTPWVEADYLKTIIDDPERTGVIVDARPLVKYMEGTIPGAVNIHYKFFEALKGLLPADPGTELIFFCGGYNCDLSHKSANAAKALGYAKIFVYAEGWPGWQKNSARSFMLVNPKNAVAVMAAETVPRVEGEVSLAEFREVLDKKPADVLLVDVRPVEQYGENHIEGAINIPEGELEDNEKALKGFSSVILYCNSGNLASSAYYDLEYLEIKGGYYNGLVNFNPDGSVTLE